MAKEKPVVWWNCATELKLLITSLFLFCSLSSLLHFLPPHFYSLSSLPPPPCTLPNTTTTTISNSTTTTMSNSTTTTKRHFLPVGSSPAAHSLILMSSYRSSPSSFTFISLVSKPLHLFSRPTYTCDHLSTNSTTPASPILPDWGYGRVYTVLILSCTFPSPIPPAATLLLHLSTPSTPTLTLTALSEPPNATLPLLTSPPKHDYLYCGSPLYGDLSPQRVREWLAYHVRLFGGKSHFVFYDAGGVHSAVLEVLRPWMELGYVTLQDVRDQERFDGYYHNQFLIVNDCLHRYRFDAKWMFFFDLDEFIYVVGKNSLRNVMESLNGFSQFTIEQMPMSAKLCLTQDSGNAPKMWGFEKLVYRDVKRGIRKDRKYAVQPRNVYATGVHMSQNLRGKTTYRTGRRIKYFHYHGTIAERREPCRNLTNLTETTFGGTPYVLDTSMRGVAPFVKRFELDTIGNRLQTTRQ